MQTASGRWRPVVLGGVIWSGCMLWWGVTAGVTVAQTAPVPAPLEADVRVAQLIRDAQKKRESGAIPDALADLRAANALIKQVKGANHPDTLPVLELAGTLLFENGQFNEAQTPLAKAVALRESLAEAGQPQPPVELAAALVTLARTEMALGAFDRAAPRLTQAAGLFEAALGKGHQSTLATRELTAAVAVGLGDVAAAEETLAGILALRQRGEGGKPEVLATAVALARARAWGGQSAAALEPLRAAIAEHQRSRGPEADLPPAFRQLAALEVEVGDLDAARNTLGRAAAIDGRRNSSDQAGALLDRLELARLEAVAGDAESAAQAAEPLVAAVQPLAARDDPRAAECLRVAAEVLLAGADYAGAADLFRQALEVDTRLVGLEHPDCAADEAGLGQCLLETGDTAAARPLLDHALAAMRRVRGPFHPDTLDRLATAGVAAAEAGDLPAAAAALQTLVDRGVPWRSEAAESLLASLADGVATLKERSGDRDGAMQSRLSVIGLRQQQFGDDHERVADMMVKLAGLRQAAGADADAVVLYERAVGIVEKARGADSPEAAAILTPLAVSYRAVSANEQAEAALARALTIWETHVGPDHPVAIATLKPLALVRLALAKEDAALPLMTRLLAAYDADPATPAADRIKLLKKLAQLQESRGAADIARGYLERAVAAEVALGKSAGMAAGDLAGDEGLAATAKLEKMLSVDEQAEASLGRARSIAADLQAAQQKLASAAPPVAARPAAPAAGGVAPQTMPPAAEAARSGQRDVEALIASAWRDYRTGQAAEARGKLQAAAATLERQPETMLTGQQRTDLAALLAARADMRPQPLAWQEPLGLYKKALTLAAAALGDGHPTTLAHATTLATALSASGDPRAAGEIETLMASKAVEASRVATPEQLERLRQALQGAAQVAAASGDRAAAVRALDTLLKLGTTLDERTIVFGLDTLETLCPAGVSDEAAGHARARYVQAANRLVPSRPAIAGYALHHLGLADEAAGKAEAALEVWRRALETDRKSLGANHPRVAWHLVTLAAAQQRRGNAAAAEQLLAEATAVEAGLAAAPAGQGAERVADLCRLAAARGAAGAFDNATRLLAAALQAEQRSGSGSPLVVASIAETSARLAASRGQEKRARDLWDETAGIVQATRGGGHPAAVAALIARDRLTRAAPVASPAAAQAGAPAVAAVPAPAQPTSRFADLLANRSTTGTASAQRPPAAGPQQQAAAAGPDASAAVDDPPAPVPMSAAGEKAMRALDAATRLYGGDPSKKKSKAGAGRRGMEAIVGYLGTMEALANGQEGGLPMAADGAGAQAAGPGPRAPTAPAAPAPSAGEDAPSAPPPGRRGTFVAASQSGLRQRTALARQRATSKVDASITVDQLMLAAWSAHERGSRAEAVAACEQALALAGRQAGDSSPVVADVLDQFATIALSEGNLPQAKQLLERLGSLRWKLLGPSDPAVATAALRLATLLADCGELERAAALASRAATARLAVPGSPAARAQAAVLLGEIRLAQGEPAAAAAQLAQARNDLAAATSAEQFAVRLACSRLARNLGDLESARDDLDALWSAGVVSGRLPPVAVRTIIKEMARTRRLAGEPAVAVGMAQRLGGLDGSASAVGAGIDQVEIAAAQQAGADASWETTAARAAGVLEPAMSQLTATATDPEAIAAVAELAALWLNAGRFERAESAVVAAARGAATLPPGHRVAAQAARAEARLALAQGDLPRARATLDRAGTDGSVGVVLRPSLPSGRAVAFLEAATDAGTRQVVLSRAEAAPSVLSGGEGRP